MGHTPGPWRKSDKSSVIYGPPEEINALAGYPNGKIVTSCSGALRPMDEKTANAYLIAAAPDLLSACKELMAALEGVTMAPLSVDRSLQVQLVLDSARAAVAKAEGGAA